MTDNNPYEVTQKYPGDQNESPEEIAPLSSEVDPTERPGHIGRYRIEKVLGKGGFGLVYLAQDEQLDRTVAVKVPHPNRIRRPEAAQEYLTEARTVANLDHPHIVPVYDVGSSSDFPCYIVSKFVEGTDLGSSLRHSPPSHSQAAEIVATVAEALNYAHTQGLVHRDVKPENILIDSDGRPYLVDFGLALREENIGKGPRYAGTPAYMSPEQARGEGHRVDGRSDIYSLGAVLYKLLTGTNTYSGRTRSELLEQISTTEPRSPRQIDDGIPKELERICLKALTRRASERYTSALDMAEDLRHFLNWATPETTSSLSIRDYPLQGSPTGETPVGTETPQATPRTDSQPIKIVPKGLRSFDQHDADFFLELLPGARDREGLPESLRFWKSRIEDFDADNTFAVGLIYGPSGCGKTSLVKAGLLPRLSNEVITVYIEATSEETEHRLLHGLRRRCPNLPADLGLKDSLASLRRGEGLPIGKKVLIIVDQFEQWLHGQRNELDVETELVQSLRQCDGANVQCLVMVRDDFWMATTRFMRALEIRLVEADNSTAVDLFSIRHSKKVLTDFGRAFGALPEDGSKISKEQDDFLSQSIEGLTEDGKIICVRLALFAEMMKEKPWSPASLGQVGGTTGVGVTFLEETFSAATAPPENRYHQVAARAILKALLPEFGTDIKGQMKSYDELLAASGYANRRQEFDKVVEILDRDLRLMTPTDPEGMDSSDDSVSRMEAGQKYFQLAHDYLVPSLRDWLTRKQRETRRGRAELRLAERAAAWNAKPEKRYLPSLWEWINIRLFTDKRKWNLSELTMMGKANVTHGFRTISATVLLVVGVWVATSIRQSVVAERTRIESESTKKLAAEKLASDRKTAASLVEGVITAKATGVPYAIEALVPLQEHVLPILRAKCDSPEIDLTQRVRAAYALARFDDVRLELLVNSVPGSPRNECANILAALLHAEDDAVRQFKEMYEAESDTVRRVRWATLLLHLGDTENARKMLTLRPDPTERTAFIHGLDQWYADPTDYIEPLRKTRDADFRSGLCLAIGLIPEDQFDPKGLAEFKRVFVDLYENASSGSVHSACDWTLRQWKEEVPPIAAEKVSDGKEWQINTVNMAMIKLSPGSFTRAEKTISLPKSYWISNREVTLDQFARFMDSNATKDKPKVYMDPRGSRTNPPTAEHPASVTWYDALLFCNWLSLQEGFRVCYERTGKKEKVEKKEFDEWRLIEDANGYRLPSENEWEYACRSQAATHFCFGNQESLLVQYCVYRENRAQPCGSKLPNGFGIFDMHGNVQEWCEDRTNPLIGSRVIRGGRFADIEEAVQSGKSNWFNPGAHTPDLGFRVVRTAL